MPVPLGSGFGCWCPAFAGSKSQKRVKKSIKGFLCHAEVLRIPNSHIGPLPNLWCKMVQAFRHGSLAAQGANICESYPQWQHISAGDCLRAERQDPNSKDRTHWDLDHLNHLRCFKQSFRFGKRQWTTSSRSTEVPPEALLFLSKKNAMLQGYSSVAKPLFHGEMSASCFVFQGWRVDQLVHQGPSNLDGPIAAKPGCCSGCFWFGNVYSTLPWVC